MTHHLRDVLTAFANCDLHFCIYGAFGAVLVFRAALCGSEHYPGEARENFVHGIVYLALGLLR
jgi:hypothetical protein